MCTFNDDNVSLTDYDVAINTSFYGKDFDEASIIEEEIETPQTDILFE